MIVDRQQFVVMFFRLLLKSPWRQHILVLRKLQGKDMSLIFIPDFFVTIVLVYANQQRCAKHLKIKSCSLRMVLGYLAYETLGRLVELCLLVRRDAAR